ncbi:hypothetical protein GCM10023187_21760 [Nibrella viscosa]|uniref:HTH LytTR-type domain-containing protein n=1 Tax=Nibrella viscosa TaxID=1084524 RepID=A0ABP8KE44_9BACT
MQDGRRFIVDYTMEDLETLVDPRQFFRLNRQYLANLSAIQKIHNYFNGKLKLELRPESAEEVLVSRERAPSFKNWLDG